MYLRFHRLLLGFIGCLALFALSECLSRIIPKTYWGDKICLWGQYTLGIYVLQTFMIEIFLSQYIDCRQMNYCLFNFLFAPLLSIIILSVSLIVIKIIHMSKWASFFLLGERSPTIYMKYR